MKRYLEYYENEWPENIAELTAVENKPFVGYLKGEGVLFTVVPLIQPNNEVWYTTIDDKTLDHSIKGPASFDPGFEYRANCNVNVVSNTYKNGLGVIRFDGPVLHISGYDAGMAAFGTESNHKLKTIILPDGFKEIRFYMFGSGDMGSSIYLESITIPSSITYISNNAFIKCSSLTSIIFKGTIELWGYVEKEEDWYSPTAATVVHCTDGDVKLVTGPAKNEIWYTTSDGRVSQYEIHYSDPNIMTSNTYTDIGRVVFNTSITTIMGNIDYGCSSFYTENGAPTLIGDRVTSIILPNTVLTLDAYAFGLLYEMSSITLPHRVINIGIRAFSNCQSLRDIYFNGTVEQWNLIEKDDTWNKGCPEITVHCTDGDVVIQANQ